MRKHSQKDAVNVFSSLRRDGIMIFVDLSWKQRHHALGNPAAGIIAFLNRHNGSFKVIACTCKQLAIKKTKAISSSWCRLGRKSHVRLLNVGEACKRPSSGLNT